MTTKNKMVKKVLMSTLTAGILFSFTACSDELEIEQTPLESEGIETRSIIGDEYYNINNESGKEFNSENWYKSNGIYLRLNQPTTSTAETKDAMGRSGYQQVILPWATQASPESNLPYDFCKDLNPENGWNLVANFCGDYFHPDANYIVLYNKYLGKLRYFYYIPQNTIKDGANDHNFEIQMKDLMAQHAVFGYALPMNKKYKSADAINANQGGYWTQYVTPWTNSSDDLGKQVPRAGWYAFDIDLSVYRGEENFLTEKDFIKTTICGYKTENVDLFADLKGDIQGDIKLEKCCVNTTSGAFGPLEDLIGQAKDIKDFVCGAKEVYSNLMSGDIFGAIEGGINVAKQGCDLVGIDYGKEQTGYDGYKGEVNMKLNGTINMAGKISSRCDVQGLSSINQSLKQFELEKSTLGQGVWNLAKSPVVYYTDARVCWASTIDTHTPSILSRTSPFGGTGNMYVNVEALNFNQNEAKNPCQGHVCYFDPSSIEVVLNKNVFTEEEIKSAKVYATCGVRKGMKIGSTETYRNAMDLGTSNFNIDNHKNYVNLLFDEAPFDAFSGRTDKDKLGMKTATKFEVEEYDGRKMGIFGRGDDDFLIEPQTLHGQNGSDWMPAYEVTVTVMIEHGNQTYVYSRTYLPEYKRMNIAQMPTKSQMLKERKAYYDESIYNQQMNHYEQVYNWMHRRFVTDNGTPTHWCLRNSNHKIMISTTVSPKEAYAAVIDGDPNSRWVGHKDNREWHTWFDDYAQETSAMKAGNPWHGKPVWYLEFHTNLPSTPTSYTLISANDAAKYPQCNPRVFGLWGKKNKNDEWTMLAFSSYNNQPEDMLPKENSKATGKIPFRFSDAKDFQYFRFEVLDVADENLMRLGDIVFNYD